MQTIAQQLARYLTELRYNDLPREVVHKVKECVLDQLGVQIRGATLPQVQPVIQFVQEMSAKPESTIVYHGSKTVAPYAAYANAIFGHSCEFDDSLMSAGHPGVCTIPVAMALAENRGFSGKALITSIVAGYEIMVRAALPIHRTLLERGWHPMKVQGVFGAAATAASLLGLGEKEATNALAIAGSDASGTMEYDQSGGEVKRMHAGMAARSGMQAALLAQKGMTGPPTIIEGKRGILKLFGEGIPAKTEDYLSKDFHTLRTIFKMYPAVGTIHSPLDALRQIIEEYQFNYQDVAQINVGVADWAVEHGGAIYHPEDALGAQFSLPFSMALRLIKGGNDLSYYMDPQLWSDSEILSVCDKVKTHVMPVAKGEGELAARVEIILKDGRKLEGYQEYFRGHPKNPPTQEDLETKFRSLASAAMPDEKVEKISQEISKLEELKDIRDLCELLNSV